MLTNCVSREDAAIRTPKLLSKARFLGVPAVAKIEHLKAIAMLIAAKPTPPEPACMSTYSELHQ